MYRHVPFYQLDSCDFQDFITKLLDTHHCQRILLKILSNCIESGCVAEGSVLFQLKEQLDGSLHVIEDMVSILQANIPELNQAKLIVAHNGLAFMDEVKWVNDIQLLMAKCDNDFCVYDEFDQVMDDANVCLVVFGYSYLGKIILLTGFPFLRIFLHYPVLKIVKIS